MIDVITAVIRLPPARVTPSERLVLFALAWHANGQHQAWPAVGTLVRETSLSRRAVQLALPRLTSKGFLAFHSKGPRGSIRYNVNLTALEDCASSAQSDGDDCLLLDPVRSQRRRVRRSTAHPVRGGVHPVRRGVHPIRH